MQITPGSAHAPAAPVVSPEPIVTSGAAAPAAPIEPARRVTASRDGGRGDLTPDHQPHAGQSAQRRGQHVNLHA